MKIIFFLSLLLIFYIYIGYYFLLFLVSLFKKNKTNVSDNFSPSVSMIIAAYNEEKVIEGKIKNTLRLEYPKDRLEVIVFSDASTDRTDEMVKKYDPEGIKLLRIEGRKGKTYGQNKAVEIAKGEIIVFSDANSIYQKDALKKIVHHFGDERIGCVSGELQYIKTNNNHTEIGAKGEGLYWKYEKKIKKLESKVSSLVGANGAIYAVRKRLYIALPDFAISDFAEPLQIFKKGYRVIYEPKAVASEINNETFQESYSRRVRVVTRTFYNFIKDRGLSSLLNPFRFGIFSLQFFSHKFLRWFSGLFLLYLLVFSLLLYNQGVFYQFICWGQILFYFMALYGLSAEMFLKVESFKIPQMIFYFCLSCWAMLVGVYQALRGNNIIIWEVKRR